MRSASCRNDEVSVDVIHRGVGAITESDILLARASGAIIVGFHVRPDNNARAAAEREGVDIKLYKVIYEAVEDVRSALEGMLRPEEREVVLGEAEVREPFKVPRMGVIAGCSVRSGVINRQGRVRVMRDSVEIYDGSDRVAAPLQGRREGSPRRIRVRYRHRELQRHQGWRRASSATARSRLRAR